MLRASFFTSITALSSCAALLSVTASVAALAGCGAQPHDGGPCQYELVGTATFTVTTITPANGSTPSDQACSTVGFTWESGPPDTDYPPGPFSATEACLAAAGVQVGSSVEWTLQQQTSGTCVGQYWTVGDGALSACNAACM